MKDPPLHRLADCLSGGLDVLFDIGWPMVITIVGWAIAIPCITLPLIGVIDGWGGQNDNAVGVLVIGCLWGLVAVIATLTVLWVREENKIAERNLHERQEQRAFYEAQMQAALQSTHMMPSAQAQQMHSQIRQAMAAMPQP